MDPNLQSPRLERRILIKMRDVEFSYPGEDFRLGVQALSFAEAARVALIGPSGCGKTTLAFLMAGLLRPGAGQVWALGQALHGATDAELRSFRRNRVGFVFQQFELLDYLSAEDNILLSDHLEGHVSRARRDQARKLAERVGVGHRLRHRPATLSQGERQRVAICRALLHEPQLLIADEPTGNLDPDTSELIMGLLHEQVGRLGCTFVMVTHDHALLERFDHCLDCRALSSEHSV